MKNILCFKTQSKPLLEEMLSDPGDSFGISKIVGHMTLIVMHYIA